MEASLREFYQKKIQRLELDNILLQEQAISRPQDEYKLKYELLLDKLAQENQLRESKRTEEHKNQEKSLSEINTKWQNILNQKVNQLTAAIESLQNQNNTLSIKNTELELKTVRLQREIDQSDSEVLKLKFDSLKKENQRLRKQTAEAYSICEKKIAEFREQASQKIDQVKEREKVSYRTQIIQLEERIARLLEELEEAKQKASPQRQANLQQMSSKLFKEKEDQSREILAITAILEKRNRQIADLRHQIEANQEDHLNLIREMSTQLKNYQGQLFDKEHQKQMEMAELQRQMGSKRQKQADELKDELKRAEEAFQRERSEWKYIIDQFEAENGKIKKDWQQQKQKYIEQKKRLKDKIGELRARLKQKDDELNKDENDRMLKSLREMDSNQQQFTSYENAITFMDRQVRKCMIKLQQKDREINSLLSELNLLQEESEKQIAYIRDKAREEVKQLYDKIFKLEDEVDHLDGDLKEKDRWVRMREKELENQKRGHQTEVENLRKIIEEMQRDYDRITSNKKSLEQSYRQERQNVITTKLDVNQQRKKKWSDLAKQKKELQLVYKQKIAQINDNHQIEIGQLKRQRHQVMLQREQLRAEVQALKEKLGVSNEENKENKYSDYQAKLASLDLEITLTQNLFKNLTDVIGRAQPHRKTQLDEMSEEASQNMSSSKQSYQIHEGEEIMTPFIQSAEMNNSVGDPFRSAAFSFFPSPKQK